MNDTFGLTALQNDLMMDEGYSALPYPDPDNAAIISIGVGRNLTVVGVSSDEVALMLTNDISRAASALDADYPWWRALPAGAQRVMLNLTFNMGMKAFTGFVKFLGCMEKRDWDGAIKELRNSEWFTQVGERGPRMCSRLAAL